MKGYCENCKKVIDETEICSVDGFIVCHGCFDKLKGNKVISYGTAKKMTRKEKKRLGKQYKEYKAFYGANKDKVCVNCGSDMVLFEIHQIDDGKYRFDGQTLVLCSNCMSNQEHFFELFNTVRK